MSSIEISDIYDKIIKQDSTFAAIGPSEHIVMDPSLLKAASLSGSQGKGYVVDPHFQNRDHGHPDQRIKGAVSGIEDHIITINKLRKLGMNLSPLVPLGPKSFASETKLSNSSVDHITDHATSLFLAQGGIGYDHEDIIQDLATIYREYLRIMVPNGTAIIQAGYGISTGTPQMVEESLRSVGLKYEFYQVADIFRVPLTLAVLGNINQLSNGDKYQYLNRILSDDKTEIVIDVHSGYSDAAIYKSDYCYICHK